MLDVKYLVDSKRCHFIIDGHANYKERELIDKFDIVCAMVSVLGQTAVLGCKTFCKGVETVVDNGHIEIHFARDNSKARVLVESCEMGIDQVKAQYPQCFK